jgi:predicted nuclease of predicted toxin-antitoxin system
MNILADENIERQIVDLLRAEGHDVLSAAESFASTADTEVLDRSAAEGRVLLPNDLDFGELVFHRRLAAAGIVLLRLRVPTLADKVRLFQLHWQVARTLAIGHFVVISNRRIRVRPLAL